MPSNTPPLVQIAIDDLTWSQIDRTIGEKIFQEVSTLANLAAGDNESRPVQFRREVKYRPLNEIYTNHAVFKTRRFVVDYDKNNHNTSAYRNRADAFLKARDE